MLEQLRKSGASIFIYLIFGLLIVIFVINFAPNAGSGQGGGCMPGGTHAIAVDGVNANQASYKIAYSGNQYNGRQKVYVALEYLVRRELLAQAAAEHGIRVTSALVDEEIKKGNFFVGGQRQNLGTILFDEIDGEKFFNFGKLKGWVNTLNVSLNSYKDEQKRGLQAALMAELIQDSVRVSREEALSNYLFENNTVTYDVVQFSPAAYRDAMRLSDADVQRFLAAHEDDVKKKWTELERTYKATKPALKLRSIFIAKLEPAKPADAPKPGDGAGSGSAAVTPTPKPEEPKVAATPAIKPVGMPIEEAKTKLEAARTAITGGKQKFADAAKQLSTDEAAKVNGGDLGWRTIENAQLGELAVNDAIKTLKPGEMTPVITTDLGAYLVIAEDKREGDLTYDQVKAELAVDLAKDLWSKEAAKRAALDGLAAARAGTGKPLDQVFEREVNMEQEQRRMQEQIERQMQLQQKQGAIITESANVPAAWTAEDPAPGSAATEGGGGGTTGSAAAGSAAKPAAGSAAGAGSAGTGSAGTGSAGTGSAGTGSAAGAGSAAPPTSTTATAEVPAVDLTPTKDVLPAFAEMPKPKVISQGPTPRMKSLPVIGATKDAIAALFDDMSAGMIAKQVYQTESGSYVLLQVTGKSAPKVEEFDKVADQEIREMRDLRAMITVEQWLKSRCEALAKDGKIKPLAELIAESDDKGAPLPAVYRPCMSFR